MAGSDIGGWILGACFNGTLPSQDRDWVRMVVFLADHPEWRISHNPVHDIHEAVTGPTDTELIVVGDTYLGSLMDRLEARYGKPDE